MEVFSCELYEYSFQHKKLDFLANLTECETRNKHTQHNHAYHNILRKNLLQICLKDALFDNDTIHYHILTLL